MSISSLESREKQVAAKVAKLNNNLALSVKKETALVKLVNKATIKVQKVKTSAQVKSATREINNDNQKSVAEKKKQADIQKNIADATVKLNKIRMELSKERAKVNEKALEQMKRENQKKIASLSANKTSVSALTNERVLDHDVFFSYAHEDSNYADELVKRMRIAGIDVVYDKDDLAWGDSIIDFIDSQLRSVRFAVLLITPAYLEKYWTNYELKSLLQRHSRANGKENLILPLWHNITADEVAERSLALTDFNALLTAVNTQDEIVVQVKKLLE